MQWVAKSKAGVRRYDALPFIADSAEFGIAVAKWWYEMQPAFRRDAGNTLATVYEAVDGSVWDPLRKSSPNGLVSVMTLLAWWGRGVLDRTQFQDDSSVQWKETVLDVKASMLSILATTDTARNAKKRKAEAEKEKSSKRRYVFFRFL